MALMWSALGLLVVEQHRKKRGKKKNKDKLPEMGEIID